MLVLGLAVGGAFIGAGGRNPLESGDGSSKSAEPPTAVPFSDERRDEGQVELGGTAPESDRYGTAPVIGGTHRGGRGASGGSPDPNPDLTRSSSSEEMFGGQLLGTREGAVQPTPLAPPRQGNEQHELARSDGSPRPADVRVEQPVTGLVREPSGAQRIGGHFPLVTDLGRISFTDDSQGVAVTPNGDRLVLTLDQELQLKARQMLQRYQVPWGAIVAIDPKTGKVLALASYSEKEPFGTPVALRASFPAASLFKIITAAAAIERSGINADQVIAFRGGNYTLGPYNALPDSRKDRRLMSIGEAMGKSVNPVFARVALNYLNPAMIERYAESFGFNSALAFDVPLEMSTFVRPETDYDTARTAAGFGPVTLSPLHAAAFTAAIANDGVMMRPYLIERAFDRGGNLKYTAHPSALRTVVTRSTAVELREMMTETVTTGTARRHFFRVKNPLLKSGLAAAKTGTLSGTNPKGVYHWFVAAAPADEPQVAIATLVIDPGGARVKSAALGREFLEYYFRTPGMESSIEPAGGSAIRLVSPRRKASAVRAAKKAPATRVRRAKRRKR